MLTKQAWSIKNLLYGQKDNFFLQYQHGHLTHVPDTDNVKQKKNNHETIPNRFYPEPTWELPILPSQVSNKNTEFASSCLLAVSAI